MDKQTPIDDNQFLGNSSFIDLQKAEAKKPWGPKDSERIYLVDRWGSGYFSFNEKGNLCANPEVDNPQGPQIDMMDIIQEMKDQGVQFPAVIRFHDILRSQVKKINQVFHNTIDEAQYQGVYRGVYPVKVNQLREVVEEIIDAGEEFNFGLEAGSKAEIMAALSINQNPEALTILNGYKDQDFIKLGLLGRKLDRKIIIVIEKLTELPRVIQISKELDIEPILGIRARLNCKGSGKWCDSSGEKAKFGLSSLDILEAIKLLKQEKMIHCLELFHFHIGSQVTDIRTFKEALIEGARTYSKICQLGVDLRYFDVGGGLAVDYDGSRSTFESSMNYKMGDYIRDVVYTLKEICDLEDVPHPDIITESGRAITAHHSCIITNVFGSIEIAKDINSIEKNPGHHHIVHNMLDIFQDITEQNILETYNDAKQKKDEAQSAFKLGILDLEEKAIVESTYWRICKKINSIAKTKEFPPEDVAELKDILIEQYMCNLSVFQSVPDSWAIDQILPIVPLHRHNERPTVNATLVDITCDSDGKINKFVDFEDVKSSLPLHPLKHDEEYFLGVFLTGAYQDIMGDNHNLFGRLNEVHVFCDDDDPNDFYIEEIIHGNKASEILNTLQWSSKEMAGNIKKNIDKKIRQGRIRPRQAVKLADFFERCLDSYPYLN